MVLSEQCQAWLGRVLNFSSHVVPDFFAIEVAALAKLVRTPFDLLVGIGPVMSAAEFRIHYNGVAMRNPHGNPLMPQRAQV